MLLIIASSSSFITFLIHQECNLNDKNINNHKRINKMLSTKEIIDIVLIPIYFILFAVALFSFFKHSRGKRTAFGLLFIFPFIRMLGNILLVAAQEEIKKSDADPDTTKDLFTAGFILQLAGYGLLFSSALALTNRAILHEDKPQDQSQGQSQGRGRGRRSSRGANGNGGIASSLLSSPSRLLHLLNSVAGILLIIGLAKSTSAFNPTSTDQSISTVAKVGTILMLVATVILFLLTAYHMFIVGPVAPSARIILGFVLVACIPMLARIAFSTYKLLDSNLLDVNTWAQLVLQYICECLAVIIILALAFTIHARGGDGDLDERKAVNMQAASNGASQQQQPYDYPSTYGTQHQGSTPSQTQEHYYKESYA